MPTTGAKVTLENAQVGGNNVTQGRATSAGWLLCCAGTSAGWLATRAPKRHPLPALPLQLLLNAYVSRLPADEYTVLRPLYRTGTAGGRAVHRFTGWQRGVASLLAQSFPFPPTLCMSLLPPSSLNRAHWRDCPPHSRLSAPQLAAALGRRGAADGAPPRHRGCSAAGLQAAAPGGVWAGWGRSAARRDGTPTGIPTYVPLPEAASLLPPFLLLPLCSPPAGSSERLPPAGCAGRAPAPSPCAPHPQGPQAAASGRPQATG
mgnify:CR=1 FL=1